MADLPIAQTVLYLSGRVNDKAIILAGFCLHGCERNMTYQIHWKINFCLVNKRGFVTVVNKN